MKYKVIAGDYKNWDLVFSFSGLYFVKGFKKVKIRRENVSNWGKVDDVAKSSFGSGVVGGTVGAMLFGPVGMVAGAAIGASRKNYQHLVSIELANGETSLTQMDDKGYRSLIKHLY